MRVAPVLVAFVWLTGCGLALDLLPGPDASPRPLDAGTMDAAIPVDADPRDAGELEACGATTCAAGLVCCNESCGVCARPGEGCITIECVDASTLPDAGPAPDGGSSCGPDRCGPSEICCPGCGTDLFCAAGPPCPILDCPVRCTDSADCPDAERCDVPTAVCGDLGTCVARPSECPTDCPGVCTCLGTTYCNQCQAQMAGEQVERRTACARPRDCAAQEARSSGVCLTVAGYAWDGFSCAPIRCACVGSDCGAIFPSMERCQLTYGECACGSDPGDPVCEPDEWCQYRRLSACGTSGATGACRPRPAACAGPYVPVCGCDGIDYGSSCEANAAGTDVWSVGPCEP